MTTYDDNKHLADQSWLDSLRRECEAAGLVLHSGEMGIEYGEKNVGRFYASAYRPGEWGLIVCYGDWESEAIENAMAQAGIIT